MLVYPILSTNPGSSHGQNGAASPDLLMTGFIYQRSFVAAVCEHDLLFSPQDQMTVASHHANVFLASLKSFFISCIFSELCHGWEIFVGFDFPLVLISPLLVLPVLICLFLMQ